MFERMEITETIYEGVVETSNKKTTIAYANHDGHVSQKRGEAESSKNYSVMGKHAGKRK